MFMDQLDDVNFIKNKADFVRFVKMLADDLKNNPERWSNMTLPVFLEAIAGWVEDMDGYYTNKGLSVPSNVDWKVFAEILSAAKVYE